MVSAEVTEDTGDFGGNGARPGRWRSGWGCLLGLVGVALLGITAWLILAIRLYQALCPPDRVEVRVDVRALAEGEEIVCLVAEGPAGAWALPWYEEAMVTPLTVPASAKPVAPGGGPLTGGRDDDRDGRVALRVQWPEAARYGVLTWHDVDRWRVHWLAEPGDLERPSFWRQLRGGGVATIRLPAADRAEVPTPVLLDQLR